MVSHLSGFCCNVSKEEAIDLAIAEHHKDDWAADQGGKVKEMIREKPERALVPNAGDPPALQRCRSIMHLQRDSEEAIFGSVNPQMGELPAGCRPQRELRCLAALVKTVGGTVRRNASWTSRWP